MSLPDCSDGDFTYPPLTPKLGELLASPHYSPRSSNTPLPPPAYGLLYLAPNTTTSPTPRFPAARGLRTLSGGHT